MLERVPLIPLDLLLSRALPIEASIPSAPNEQGQVRRNPPFPCLCLVIVPGIQAVGVR